MSRLKQTFGGAAKNRLWAGSIIGIMFFLPNFAFALTYEISCVDDGTPHAPQSCTGSQFNFGTNYWESTQDYFDEFAGQWYVKWTGNNISNVIRVGDIGSTDDVNLDGDTIPCTAIGSGLSGSFVLYLASEASGSVTLNDVVLSTEPTCVESEATAEATIQVEQALFNGILLFMLSAFFIVWYFRGKVVQ